MTKTLAVKEILCLDKRKFLNLNIPGISVNIGGLPSKTITTNGYLVGNIIITVGNYDYILKNTVYYTYDNTKYTVKEITFTGALSGDILNVAIPSDFINGKFVRFLGVTSVTKTASAGIKIKYLEEI